MVCLKGNNMNSNYIELAFVILHYNTLEDTKNCVESIEKNIDTNNYMIIIVDNASPNGSGEQLDHIYKNIKKYFILHTKQNLGFARGNNIGIQYAVQTIKAKFICCLNNDTLLTEKKFFAKISKKYEKKRFGVLGPRIINKEKKIQLYSGRIHSIEEYKKELEGLKQSSQENYKMPDLSFNKRIRLKLKKIPFVRSIIRGIKILENRPFKEKENILIHGCFVVFSPIYLNAYEGFYPKTFLYHEEELLFLQAREKNLLVLYAPDICIQHMEDSATNSVCENYDEKQKFILNNEIDSLKVLIEFMEAKNL